MTIGVSRNDQVRTLILISSVSSRVCGELREERSAMHCGTVHRDAWRNWQDQVGSRAKAAISLPGKPDYVGSRGRSRSYVTIFRHKLAFRYTSLDPT